MKKMKMTMISEMILMQMNFKNSIVISKRNRVRFPSPLLKQNHLNLFRIPLNIEPWLQELILKLN